MIMDNQTLKQQMAQLKSTSNADQDSLRGEVQRLMSENHHYQRDIDRYIKDNNSMKAQLAEFKAQHETLRQDMHKLIVDKESEIERLLNEVT